MIVIQTIKEMQEWSMRVKKQGKSIGFVPTMGYLHEGHLSLMKRATEENDFVVASIFVNPLQFGPDEDFESYPRDLEHDEKLAGSVGVDVVFYPSVEEMYPHPLSVSLTVEQRTDVLCGKTRTGHFDGVVTVLMKLFHLVGPNRAYFGIKDAQQVAVVESFVRDFHFPLKIVRCPIVREADGLAKSSRNVYLTKEEREVAPILYKSLQLAKQKIAEGETNPETIKATIQSALEETKKIIDYIEIYSFSDLQPLPILKGEIIIAIAVKFSKARLIDNVILQVGGK
ncbi:pantoate--beta-alanine ligase [Massilibacterium senegalense]|uniref:pantoate--beta-alanine ligase n=1 Tax=Massilibacterium senegalense TaxID=1632858 RepID=UPI000784C189|nr:pantoate--beta-alanine ligase [Massilibacterium senegalense]